MCEAFELQKYGSNIALTVGYQSYLRMFLKLGDKSTATELINWYFSKGRAQRTYTIHKQWFDLSEVLGSDEAPEGVSQELFDEMRLIFAEHLLTLYDNFISTYSNYSSLSDPLLLINDFIKFNKIKEATEMVKIVLHTIQVFIIEKFPKAYVDNLEKTDFQDTQLWDRDIFYNIIKSLSVQAIPSDANVLDYIDLPDDLTGSRGLLKMQRKRLLATLSRVKPLIGTIKDRALQAMYRKLYGFLNPSTKKMGKEKSESPISVSVDLSSKQMEYRGSKLQIDGLLSRIGSEKSQEAEEVNEIANQFVQLMRKISTTGLSIQHF
jgi:hypothetical protein